MNLFNGHKDSVETNFVNTEDVRHRTKDVPDVLFHMPDDMHPAILSRLIYSYTEAYNFTVFPAMLITLWQKKRIALRLRDDPWSEYLPVELDISKEKGVEDLPPYEKAVFDIFDGFGQGTINAEEIENKIRKNTTRVETLLSHSAYTITQEIKEKGALETVDLPLQKGEHPPLKPLVKILVYLSLFLCFFAGAEIHRALFLLSAVPIYFIFFRKTGQTGQRLTEEMEVSVAKWDAWVHFIDEMTNYPEQARRITVREWDRAIPYLLVTHRLEKALKDILEVSGVRSSDREFRKSILQSFYHTDVDGNLSLESTLLTFLQEFEKACIHVFYVSKSGRHDFSFKRKGY